MCLRVFLRSLSESLKTVFSLFFISLEKHISRELQAPFSPSPIYYNNTNYKAGLSMPVFYSAPGRHQEPQSRFYPPQGANKQNEPPIPGAPAPGQSSMQRQTIPQAPLRTAPMPNQNTQTRQAPVQMPSQHAPMQQPSSRRPNQTIQMQQAPAPMPSQNIQIRQAPVQMPSQNTPTQQPSFRRPNQTIQMQQAPASVPDQNVPIQQNWTQVMPQVQEHNTMPHRNSGNVMYFEQRHPFMLQRLYGAADSFLSSYGKKEFIYDTYPDYLSLRLMRDRLLRENQPLTEEFLQAGCPIEWLELLTDAITSELLCRRRQHR